MGFLVYCWRLTITGPFSLNYWENWLSEQTSGSRFRLAFPFIWNFTSLSKVAIKLGATFYWALEAIAFLLSQCSNNERAKSWVKNIQKKESSKVNCVSFTSLYFCPFRLGLNWSESCACFRLLERKWGQVIKINDSDFSKLTTKFQVWWLTKWTFLCFFQFLFLFSVCFVEIFQIELSSFFGRMRNSWALRDCSLFCFYKENVPHNAIIMALFFFSPLLKSNENKRESEIIKRQ